jgi:DNA repair protein RecO (recombination protein O)
MAQMSTVLGMVIATQPIGEFDRRIVLLTKEKGKITAFAKGARRQNSSLLAASNAFAFGTFYLYEGRNSYTVRQAEIQNYFSEFRTDLEGAWYGMYFLEIADYFTRENNDEREMLKLLYQTMRALISPHLDNKLVRYIFEWKAMVINGEYPDVFQCSVCGKAAKSAFFDSEHFVIICDECVGEHRRYQELSQSTLYTLQYIAGTPVERLYTFQVTEQVLLQMKKVIEFCKNKVIDREFKTEEFLKNL